MPDIKLPGRKEFGHLTLLREPRSISSNEFNALAPGERLDIIRQARGAQKYNLLVEAHDGEALVAEMAAQELFLLIKEIGREDVEELIAWATTEQFTTFLDLDIWHGDQLDPVAMLHWLQLLLDAGDEKVMQLTYQLDFELLVLMVKKFVNISRGPEDASDDDQGGQPASGYEVEYLDVEGGKVVGAFLDVLYRIDPQLTHNLLRTVRWEQNSLLEEEVFQGRCRRLEEFGFVDPVAAQAIFSWLDPATFNPADYRKDSLPVLSKEAVPPGFLLTATSPQDLLAAVFANGLSHEGGWELSYLLNAVMSADRVEVGDPEQVQAALEQVYRCLNLALEHLCGSDGAAAIELFEQVYLKPLFRFGFSLTLQLQRQAKPLLTSSLAPYFDAPGRALLQAVSGKKPQFYERLANRSLSGTRPFKTLDELRLATLGLQRLELQVALFAEDLLFSLAAPEEIDLTGYVPAQAEELKVSDLFLTALANRLLGRPFLPQPIPVAELPQLHLRVCQDGRLGEDLRQETVLWLESLRPGGGAFAEECLAIWAEEFCPLSAQNLDPRYLAGLIIRL